MILELAHNISVIWPNQLQNRTQRNAHAQVYTNKICRVINQWNWGWAERHVLPRPNRPDCTLEYLAQTGIHIVVKTCQLPSALTTSSHTRKKMQTLHTTVLKIPPCINHTSHHWTNSVFWMMESYCAIPQRKGSRTSENHHPLQQGCHTQEADCVLTCRWSTEDGDASSISSPAAELCHLSSVCTTRLLLRGRGNPSSSTAPQAYTHRESSNRDNVQFTVTRVKQQLLVTHFNFPLAPCHETFTVISSSKTTSPFHSHSFNWFVGYRFIFSSTVWFTKIYICNDTAVTVFCFHCFKILLNCFKHSKSFLCYEVHHGLNTPLA